MVPPEGPPALDDLACETLFSLDHPALASLRPLWPPATPPDARAATPAASPERAPAPWATPQPARPSLPVLDWLTRIAADRHGFAGPLVDAVCRAGASLPWRQTYTTAEIDTDFLRNYGYTEIIGLNAPRWSRQLACGFLLLGPRTLYPRHRHDAEEIYVSLRGEAGWLQGDDVWRQHPPGTLIHHAGGEPHAMRTAAEPLLALYVWYGADLTGTARLDTA